MSSPSPPPPGGEEEEGVVVVMASLQLLLPFCCKGDPLPAPPPPPTAAAEATTLTGAFCIATALLPFLSFPSLFSQKKLNQKLQMNFTLDFLKKDFKLIFSKGLVQILLRIATKEEDEEELLSHRSFVPSFHPPPAPQGVYLWRPHI